MLLSASTIFFFEVGVIPKSPNKSLGSLVSVAPVSTTSSISRESVGLAGWLTRIRVVKIPIVYLAHHNAAPDAGCASSHRLKMESHGLQSTCTKKLLEAVEIRGQVWLLPKIFMFEVILSIFSERDQAECFQGKDVFSPDPVSALVILIKQCCPQPTLWVFTVSKPITLSIISFKIPHHPTSVDSCASKIMGSPPIPAAKYFAGGYSFISTPASTNARLNLRTRSLSEDSSQTSDTAINKSLSPLFSS